MGHWLRDGSAMRPSKLDVKFGSFLRKARGDLAYRVFCKKVGLTRSTLFRIENLEQSVTLERLSDILKRLDVSWVDVFSDE